jgi:hypothetical protein
MLAIMMIAALNGAEVRTADRATADHLSPLDFSDRSVNNYRSFLAAKLGMTPFDCGRIIDTPSFEPESIVSVYSETQNGHRAFYVTSVQAAANLWQSSKSMRDLAQAQTVSIQRINAEISESIAKKIRTIWTKMLRDAHVPPPLGLEFELDGKLGFSIQQPDGLPLDGELWLPPPGPKTQALVKISDALGEYCKATPANRTAVANKIDREATRLLEQLK